MTESLPHLIHFFGNTSHVPDHGLTARDTNMVSQYHGTNTDPPSDAESLKGLQTSKWASAIENVQCNEDVSSVHEKRKWKTVSGLSGDQGPRPKEVISKLRRQRAL